MMVDKAFWRLDNLMQGRNWLVLDRRTVADAYLHVMCRFKARTPTPLSDYSNLDCHFRKLTGDAGVRRALFESGLPPKESVPPRRLDEG